MNALLIVLRGGTETKRFILRNNQSLIMGRAKNLILLLEDPRVSRHHLLFDLRDGVLKIKDMDSRNGTTHKHKRLKAYESVRVQSGDEIEIGDHLLRVIIANRLALEDPVLFDGTRRLAVLPAEEFAVRKALGSGASGTVYLVEQKLLRRLVAVKLLHKNLTDDPIERARFLEEARLCAQIDSPHVVKMIDVRHIQGRLYLIMEYVNGSSARELLNIGHVNVAQILKLGEHVALALQTLLEVGIVHRDIKPGNILLDQFGIAKLADFGIARPIMRQNSLMLTPAGEGIGTLLYISPEQACDGKNADELSDIYSFGATLYHLLAQKPPHNITNVLGLSRLLHEEPIPLIERMPDCPPLLSDLIMRMLAKEPRDRPSGPSEIIDTLEKVRNCTDLSSSRTHW